MTAAILGIISSVTFFGGWALIMTLRAWRIDVNRIAWKTAAEGLAVKVIQEEASREAAEETIAELASRPAEATTHGAFAEYLAARRKRMLQEAGGGDGTSSGEDVSPDVGSGGVSNGSGGSERGLSGGGGLLERLLGETRARMVKASTDLERPS